MRSRSSAVRNPGQGAVPRSAVAGGLDAGARDTGRRSMTERAPLLPPQMKPLPEVMDGGTGVRLTPAARPFPSPQIAPCGQEEPHRTAVSWMYTKPSLPAIARGDAALCAEPVAVTAP